MIETMEISVTPAVLSKLSQVDIENVPFGKFFTDHMLEADYQQGEWKNVRIRPYQPLVIDPGNAAIHYGQSIFEGIKAYKNPQGEISIFRPLDNFHRFNISAQRMQMPVVPEEIFMEGMRRLINMDKEWVPSHLDHSLYIRPFMFATDPTLGVKPSESYKFMIILSPTGPYYTAPMRINVEEKYTRAAPGGVGYAKTAGNYAAAMYPTAQAQKQGYQQVLWTDAFEHKYVQEIGTMNVFFLVGNKVLTPSLEDGTILAGVTRNSTIDLLHEMGYEVEERRISIDELIAYNEAGELKELFGAGTAATISMIKELKCRDTVMHFDTDSWQLAPALLTRLNDIRYGKVADTHGWMFPV